MYDLRANDRWGSNYYIHRCVGAAGISYMVSEYQDVRGSFFEATLVAQCDDYEIANDIKALLVQEAKVWSND